MRVPTILMAVLVATGCSKKPVEEEPPPRITYTEEREPCEEYDHLRNAYFGDLHSHTGFSFDAVSYGNNHSPSDAYAFAKGAPTGLPPIDSDGEYERTVALARPLDFSMVSDHAEFLGEVGVCTTTGSGGYDHETCQWLRDTPEDAVVAFGVQTASMDPVRVVDCDGDLGCVEDMAAERWQALQDAAEEHYDRTAACDFVTFVGYEYTNTFQVTNHHRNVVFRNADVPPLPTTYYEALTPYDLWTELADQCLDADTTCDVMSIPHNMNLSNGRMFVPDYTGDERDAASLRARLEPVVEMYQQKGDMECRNGFDGLLGEPDPLCDFEKQWPEDADDCGEGTGSGGMRLWGCVSRYDFVRNIFKLGLQEEARIGVNPYRMGVIAATDTHNAIPGMVAEDDYHGHVGIVDDTPEERLSTGTITHDRLINNPGGLAGVWAEERSRDAIFEAMRRGETFATSGPRIQVRIFGGWNYPDDLCTDPDWVEEGYDGGSPMGGDLPAMSGDDAPRFIVWAEADPLGAPLQHVQVVKGWVDAAGDVHERVFDVAGDPESSASVDTDTCTASGPGEDVLCSVWTDDTFDPDQPAFWYVRALQNPTCRWSTWECLGLEPADRPEVCDDPDLVRAVQERAWSSPIWYSPAP